MHKVATNDPLFI